MRKKKEEEDILSLKKTFKGVANNGRLNIFIPKRYLIGIPNYFTIILDLTTIKPREKDLNKKGE